MSSLVERYGGLVFSRGEEYPFLVLFDDKRLPCNKDKERLLFIALRAFGWIIVVIGWGSPRRSAEARSNGADEYFSPTEASQMVVERVGAVLDRKIATPG